MSRREEQFGRDDDGLLESDCCEAATPLRNGATVDDDRFGVNDVVVICAECERVLRTVA